MDRKIPGYDQIIQDIFELFIKHKSYSRVAKEITNKYNAVLNRPLSRDVIKRVLSDPVYVGRPSFLGETVIDESLRYIDDATFEKCRSFKHDNSSNMSGSVQQKSSTLARLTQIYDVSLLDFIEEVAELRHRRCGGLLTRNGSRFENSTLQQVYKCNKCNAQLRIPTKQMLEKLSGQNRIQSTNLIPQTRQSSKQRMEQRPKRSVQTSLFDYSAFPTEG